MEVIKSKANEKVKYIKSLNEKKFRNKFKNYYLEGIKVVREIIDSSNKNLEYVALSKELLLKHNNGDKLLELIVKSNVKVIYIQEDIFKYIVDTVSPQGVLAIMKIEEKTLEDINSNEDILVLDGLQDAGNVGSIIRTAVGFNIKNIICTNNNIDVYMPKVLRATMSCIFKVNIIYENNQDKIIEYAKNNKYCLVTSTLNSKSKDIREAKFNGKNMFVVGNEANGVEKIFEENADICVKIPIEEELESLNVLSATSIILYKNYVEKS